MLQKHSISALFFFAATFLFFQTDVFACSCAARQSVLDSFENSDLVITTKLISIEEAGENESHYGVGGIKSATMRVEKVYKGNVKIGDELTFAQGGGADCIWTFNGDWIGEEFLFYVGKSSKGNPFFGEEDKNAKPMYYAVTCGRSRGLKGAIDDLLYLDNLDKTRGRTRLSGELDSWNGAAPSFANLKIKIIGKNKIYEAKTDANGVYEIYDLPPGEYVVEPPILNGWKISDYMLNRYSEIYDGKPPAVRRKAKNQISVTISEKRHTALDLLFEIDNAIRGKVFSPVGKPMKDVCVMAVSSKLADGDYRGPFNCTNEKGEFEIDELTPGNYLLVVNDDGKISSSEPFGTLFYPGVADRRQASVVAVDLGKFLNNVNIQIPKTEELVEISGRLLFSDGKPIDDEWIEFVSAEKSAKLDGDTRTKTDAQGRFKIKILKNVSGSLFGEMYVYVGKYKNCPAIDNLVKKAGEKSPKFTTDKMSIQANDDLTEVKLTFPFRSCVRADD